MKALTLVLLVAIASIGYGIKGMASDYQDYLTSSKCAMELVVTGIARSDIEIDGPTCYIKGE